MADDSNEDHWLYGDSNPDAEVSQDKNDTNQPEVESNHFIANSPVNEEANDLEIIQEQNGDEQEEIQPIPEPEESRMSIGEEEQAQIRLVTGSIEPMGASVENSTVLTENGEDDDDDDSDDDVQVVIGDIKTSTTYSSLNIKRGGLLTSSGTAGNEKLKQPGKFSIEEFEAVGTINGVPAHEFNLDSMEDKPWRKPGADITDYFNYGFNEETWRAYCERQKRIRVHESGVGLAQLGSTTQTTGTGRGIIPVAITNDNSKYSGFLGPKKAGPPPGRKMAGTIDVIGAGGLASRRGLDKGQTPPKENQVIQVMTADRREYSRKPGFPDMTIPPPLGGGPPQPAPPPPPGFDIPPMGGFADDYHGPDYFTNDDPYYHGYEPTQDSQWDPTWHPTTLPDVKVLTPLGGGGGSGTTTASGMNAVIVPLGTSETSNQDSQGSGRASSREPGDLLLGRASPTISLSGTADASNSSREHRIKDRHRSHRHRSRSRSGERSSRRRHKSRSRSPNHRSHKKKKSRRSDHEKKEESE